MRLLDIFGAAVGDQALCQVLGNPEFPLLSKEGDVTIGGAFSIHSQITEPPLSFTDTPQPLVCSSVNLREFRFAQTMIFAIEEINSSDTLLPNVSIGYRIYDNCGSTLSSMRAAMALMNSQEKTAGTTCSGQSAVHAIIGESESSSTIVLSRTTGPFKIPLISHSATCECLSSRKEYPSFFRTIASDLYQSRALAQLVKYFGWSWVGAVNSDSDYGNNGMAIFLAAAMEEGVCVEYSEKFSRTEPEKLLKVVDVIRRGTARVIVGFLAHVEMNNLLAQLSLQNTTGFQFIGVEAWITADSLITPTSFSVLGGSLGFAVQKANISGFSDYALKHFWDTAFECTATYRDNETRSRTCRENQDLTELKGYNADVAELRYSGNVYKAVYAIAHSLHSLLNCTGRHGCDRNVKTEPWEVVESLKRVNFTVNTGDQVWFDSTGAAAAKYDVVNWQRGSDGVVQFKPVGYYDASLPAGQQFVLRTDDIVWPGARQQEGDVTIGGVFSIHGKTTEPPLSFTDTPQRLTCSSIDLREFRFAQTMIFAIEEINNSSLLPNISIGYRIYDGCGSTLPCMHASMALMSGQERTVGKSCLGQSAVHAIIGTSESSTTTAMSQSAGAFQIPVISHFATCACLSNRKEFPTFFRTIPSDFYQSRALAKLVKHFGWTWVGAIRSDNDYGNNGMATFITAAGVEGVCIEYSETILLTSPREQIAKVVSLISRASSKVLVAFLPQMEMEVLLAEVLAQNLTGLQWVASESWITDTHLATRYSSFLSGTLGFAIRKATITGLREFMLRVGPVQDTNNALLREFWEVTFGCRWSPQKELESWHRNCSGSEKLEDINNPFTDTELRISNNVYKAVYAVAQSIHNLLTCRYTEEQDVRNCTHKDSIKPGEILSYLRGVNFLMKSGERIFFDENGDPEATYDLVNWQRNEAEEMSFVTVGYYNASLPNYNQFALTGMNITWAGNSSKISHFATCACLSNKKDFPTFFRTIPSDFNQSRALAKLVKHFGWTWVGAIRSDNDYGNYGMADFIKAADIEGVCIEYSEAILLTSPREQIAKVVSVISRASSRVLVAFMSQLEMEVLLAEALAQNLNGLQWVASESWITDTNLATRYSSILGGTLGFAIRKAKIAGHREFMLRVGPAQDTNNALLREFWEVTFGCRWSPQKELESWQKKCSGSEKLEEINNPFTDMAEMRISNNVYKAVYAVAQSIHDLLTCRYAEEQDLRNCTHRDSIKPGEILSYLRSVNFLMKSGERLFFDENGDPEATYDLVNWQRNEAEMSFVTVGYYNASLPNHNQFALTGMNITWAGNSSKEGDVNIGGVFTIHGKTTEPPLFFTDTPQPLTCSSLNLREFRFAQTMIFAIEEINNSSLLPNISIGYRIYDSCGSTLPCMHASMALMNGQERTVGKSCLGQSAVHAIIGTSESSTTMAMSQSAGAFQIPVISHFATCACLSNKKEFPTFFRTIPSDFYQSRALAKLVKHFGWTWVGAIRSDNDYGNHGMADFIKAADIEGVCIEYSEAILRTSPREQIAKVVALISRASSRVLVSFMSQLAMEVLLEEALAQNLTGLQWVASESWITDTYLATRYSSILGGTLGFAIRKATIPGLREFLLRVGPAQDTNNSLLREFWEVTFGCRWSPQKELESWQRNCSGSEKLEDINNPFTDMSELRISNNVYKAVYAVAQSIHDLLTCRYAKEQDVINCTHSDSIKPGETALPVLSADGDINIGAVFSLHSKPLFEIHSFTSIPEKTSCISFNPREFQFAQTLIFALEEINNRSDLLPGLSLGYQVYDSCGSVPLAIQSALALMNSPGIHDGMSDLSTCSRPPAALGIVGESSSTPTIGILSVAGSFSMPVISHFATCACLSDRKKYPSFFRTIPSDLYQSRALAKLVKHFGWTWVGVVNSNNDYGNNGVASFVEAALQEGVCVEYQQAIYRTDSRERLLETVRVMRRATARVVVLFLGLGDLIPLLNELALDGDPGLQWVGSESWITARMLAEKQSYGFLRGAVGFAVGNDKLDGLEGFLDSVHPSQDPGNALLREFWETVFQCSFKGSSAELPEGGEVYNEVRKGDPVR
ncbi:hypothetical protein DPEC_G00244110 [Dallia pectoralis]|uniref:Uncharacterized protein n=1 Tax=Dallia pectoralis TaxID=75939 RepID=A0ACC2FVC7_DALPE|nr:hypothetical protein DPEC_G00244110 [Dallia pectoralis]